MYWTWPSGLFFIGLFLVLVIMGVWDRFSPSVARKGFLPIQTTRGDRLFIAIISVIGIHLVWLAIMGTSGLIAATAISAVWVAIATRWG